MKISLITILIISLAISIQASTQASLPIFTPNQNSEELSPASPEIHDIVTNDSIYTGGIIPRYERFEITFLLDTSAQNLQLPYDENPPAGIQPGIGISVDALFSPDNWNTTYTQPAFYFQVFDDQVKNNREWIYPTGNFEWKVRFTPQREGSWQYKLVARDAAGVSELPIGSFQVGDSDRKGFIRVSASDPRYFEYDNGSYFPALGYNMNYDHVSWNDSVLQNQENFQLMSRNGIQLVRIWLSQWGIYDSSWNPWNSIDPNLHGQYIPFSGLTASESYPGSDVSMKIAADRNPCMFIGFSKSPPAVKRNTQYRVRIRYKTYGMDGPRIAGHPYGFVAKTGGWLWGDGQDCQEPDNGTVVTDYQPANTGDWQILEGSLTTGQTDFLPNFYLVVENVNAGNAYVDTVWIEEDLGNGQYGPNIVTSPWMAFHLYMEQRNSFAFDKVVELAEQSDIYLRPVIMEKNSWIFNRFDFNGDPIPYNPACDDGDPNNDPQECPGNEWFYGNWRQITKVRWLQQSWWRYLQARWGYSTSIHSWELLNEGDPASDRHFTLADEFGKYMHQFEPDDHMVSTSFWHSFPRNQFWANPEYSNIDFADIHLYIPEDDPLFDDSSRATYNPSMSYGALEPGGASKPVIRGETGFTVTNTEPPSNIINEDSDGIWLHNYIWGGINPGGLIESYWYENFHIYRYRQDGTMLFDHRDQFRRFYDFIKSIPLNNGNYQDVAAVVSVPGLRAWGQKDLVNNQAHLWIQNEDHIWRNVVTGMPIEPVSGDVLISGFPIGAELTVEWWDTSSGHVIGSSTQIVDQAGTLALHINGLDSDTAVKIYAPLQLNNHIFLPHIHTQ